MATTELKLWDVVCVCGFQSAAKRSRDAAELLVGIHERKAHAQPPVVTVRELTAQLDELGRVVPPVVVG